MRKFNWKKVLSMTMAALLVLNLFIGVLPMANAASYDIPKAGDKVKVSLSDRITRSDNGKIYQVSANNHSIRDFHFKTGNYDPNIQLYCIEFGKVLPNDLTYTAVEPESDDFWNRLGALSQEGILLTLGFGYPATSISELGAKTDYDAIAATQALVWEFATGARTAYTGFPENRMFYNAYIKDSPAYDAYWNILEKANDYREKSGYNFSQLLEQSNFMVWTHPGCQTLMAYSLPSENPWLAFGNIEIQKVDENGNGLAGAVFSITNEDGVKVLLPETNESGFTTNTEPLPYGVYTVKEEVYPTGYTSSGETEWVVVISEESAGGIEKLVVMNQRMYGYVAVNKADEDGNPLANVSFTVYSDSGLTKPVCVMNTNSDGVATSNRLPAGQKYYIRETKAQDPDYMLDLNVYEVYLSEADTVWVNNGNQIINYLATGAIGIKKADMYGNFLSGVVFGIYEDAACTKELDRVTTDELGEAYYGVNVEGEYTLRARTTYYVKELKTASDRYVLDTTVYAVTVKADRLAFANNNTSITNYFKNGAISIKKVDQNSVALSGVTFGVYLDENCNYLLSYITTDATGAAQYGVDANGNYTLEDGQTFYLKEAATKNNAYIIDTKVYPVTVKGNEVVVANDGKAVVNTQKTWKLNVKKSDSVTGNLGAGEASVVGAVFGLYNKNDELLKTYTIGSDGTFATDTYPSDIGYYFKEVTAPTGYELDQNRYYVDEFAAPTCLINAYTESNFELTNDVKTGVVSINKFTENISDPGNFTVPENGAVFEIYLKSAGSYENATKMDDDRIYDRGTANAEGKVIWSTGTAYTKKLAYGTYVVHQVSGWDNRELVNDFEVKITDSDQHFTYDLKNPLIDIPNANITIYKRDSESKKVIASGEAKFNIQNKETKEYLTYTNPATGEETNVFVTTNGSFTLPSDMPYGTYEIIEIEAPAGYMKSEKAVEFTYTMADKAAISFDIYNDPMKGVIEIEKTGMQFVSVTETTSEFGVLYTPEFANAPLAGVSFNIVAAADIVTGDGVTHYQKGDIVEVVTTGENGIAKSSELYCGQYIVIEREAPAGYLTADNGYAVDVKNDGTEKVALKHIDIVNERMSTNITLSKNTLTWDVNETENEISRKLIEVPGAGFTFGVYAGEEFVALDGTKIAHDALVAIMVTGADGKATCNGNLPFGKFYVKELEAPDAHEYILDENRYEINLDPANADNGCVAAAVNDGKALVNDFKKYSVTITKKDLTSSEPVKGALVVIKNENGDILYKEYTSEDGTLPNIILEPGKYTFCETVAPEGYILNETVFAFEVGTDGTVTGTTEFTNERVPVTPEPDPEPTPDPKPEPTPTPDTEPKTGDNAYLVVAAVLMVVAAISVVALIWALRRKEVR